MPALPALLTAIRSGAGLGLCPGRGQHRGPATSQCQSLHRQRRRQRTGESVTPLLLPQIPKFYLVTSPLGALQIVLGLGLGITVCTGIKAT